MLARLAAVLDARPRTLAELRTELVAPDWHSRDLGFGATSETAGESVGGLTIRVDAFAHRERLALWTAGVYWPSEPRPQELAAVEAVLGARLRREPDGRAACDRVRDEDVLAALHAERISVLGEAPAGAVPEVLRPPLALLTELGSLIVGERCGFASSKTPGHAATEALAVARRADLLAVALRGANAGGRVFAARALLRSRAASADDLRVIALLRGQPTPVTACAGCTHWRATAAELLPE